MFAAVKFVLLVLYCYLFLADHTVCSMIGYWHGDVVCRSVCPSVSDAVHCGQMIHRYHLRSARRYQLSVPRVQRSTFGTRAFLSPDLQFGTHCLMICVIQL